MICERSCLGDCGMPRATMAIDTHLPARRSGYERVSVDIVQDDAAFGLKRAIFTSESCCHAATGLQKEEGGGEVKKKNKKIARLE